MDERQVYEEAREVLDFWFGLPADRHFAKDDALDREIADRFAPVHAMIAGTDAAAWRGDHETLLAAVIMLDQFSRNMFRGRARAYAFDPLALALTLEALERGWDAQLPPERRVFLYLPLMHAEAVELQALSVSKYEELGLEENLRFAREHQEVIELYGRFPTRNAVLNRRSTPAEEEYLANPDVGW